MLLLTIDEAIEEFARFALSRRSTTRSGMLATVTTTAATTTITTVERGEELIPQQVQILHWGKQWGLCGTG